MATSTPTKPRTDIAILIAGGGLANCLVNKLTAHFGPITVIQEAGEGADVIFKRRVKLKGWWNALGQHLFTYYGLRLVGRLGKARIDEVCAQNGLSRDLAPNTPIRMVPSVNSPECLSTLQEIKPRVVVVYGTRLLKQETLSSTDAAYINYHAGLNPKYRGQSGAYWALRQGDGEHAGLTIHLVDKGVDTGAVLYQARSTFTRADNFATYHFVQMAQAAPLMIRAVEDALAGNLKPFTPDLPSQQFFMPTLWGYVWAGVTKGVW